jgi:phosphoenolpyruvate phosphomutase
MLRRDFAPRHALRKRRRVTKARKLPRNDGSAGPIVIIGAHNGLSARIGEEAGFDGLWASGFEISASYAVPDANILTMAENLSVAKMMNASSKILPIVADCDNGYGNAINVIRCVEEYEARRHRRRSASRTTSSPSGAASTRA